MAHRLSASLSLSTERPMCFDMGQSASKHAVLDLKHHVRLKRGKQRYIYLIKPDGPSVDATPPMVLKIPRYRARQKRLSIAKRILRKLFPYSGYRVITKEADYLNKLKRSNPDAVESLPIPNFIDYVETSEGRGVLWEAICDESGGLAPTVEELCESGQFEGLPELLSDFVQVCFERHIVAPDIHAKNLTLTLRGGRKKLFLVDGFGDHRIISIRALWPWYNNRSLNEGFEKLARQTGIHFDGVARRFVAPEQFEETP